MDRSRFCVYASVGGLLLLATLQARAADMAVNVTGILNTTDGSFGGCMFSFSPGDAIAVQGGIAAGEGAGQCSAGYISMDCDGNVISKSKAQAQVSAAQLSMITGNRLYVVINSSQKFNSYCTASRVDNLPN